ncbi:putative protease SohB [Luminiphilus syltensis NOR5-1B]|uniref:Putative protease SohB n=1 Tax=Luminiphilus syltensis NOR5-1B TaxID=565045 RepID=B8KSC3_9GAMM|nr:protease SohB [Luminiphilus syltensis]EED34657.1 putative protease SohB [Luminiphilus syltensis NOR5-1B]
MELFSEIAVFFFEAIILVVAILLVVAGVVALTQRRRGSEDGYIEVREVNERYTNFRDTVRSVTEDEASAKRRKKEEKKQRKVERKAAKKKSAEDARRPRLFVLNFDGDLRAAQVEQLREELSAILPEARKEDEVLVRLESPGGMVHSYGLAASQLRRVVDAEIPLTVAVDKVAASGGYMMACVADKIIAAPFAVIGSIGVIAQLPNFHKVLKKNDIDFELLTAGEYKRTLTMFGENTDKGRQKFLEELEDTHALFKQFVAENRKQVAIEQVATGEVWFGQRALDVQLVDQLCTSDEYLQKQLDERDIIEVRYVGKRHWQEKLGLAAESAIERALLKVWQQATQRRLH